MNVLKRVISAAILIGLLVGIIIWGPLPTLIMGIVVAFLMMLDVSNAFISGGYKVHRVILCAVSAALFPAVHFFETLGYCFLVAIAFSMFVICVIFSKEPSVKDLIADCFLLVYPLFPATLLVQMLESDLIYTASRDGMILVVGAVVCASLADTFAYVFGMLLGKKKLCPHISPKKTIAGSVASFFGGAIGGIAVSFFSSMDMIWVIIGFLCGGFAQIGDLTASLIKRHCNIKDYGKYIPGHGGIMDRMDSISACLIVVYLCLSITSILY